MVDFFDRQRCGSRRRRETDSGQEEVSISLHSAINIWSLLSHFLPGNVCFLYLVSQVEYPRSEQAICGACKFQESPYRRVFSEITLDKFQIRSWRYTDENRDFLFLCPPHILYPEIQERIQGDIFPSGCDFCRRYKRYLDLDISSVLRTCELSH